MKTAIKTLAVLGLCLVFLLSLVSCSNKQDPNAPEGYVTASDECADYYLYVPSKWLVDTAKNSLMASARASQYTSTPNVSMMPCSDDASEYVTIADYWNYYKGTLEKVFDPAKDENGNTTDKSSFALEGICCGGDHAPLVLYHVGIGIDPLSDLSGNAVDGDCAAADLLLGGTAGEHPAIGKIFLQSYGFHIKVLLLKNTLESPPKGERPFSGTGACREKGNTPDFDTV